MKALFKSVNLIGDALYISPALRQWIIDHQADGNLDITILTLDDHITPLYRGMVRDWPSIEMTKFHVIFEEPTLTEEQQYDFRWTFDVNDAFKLSDEKHQHLAQSYADLLGVKLNLASKSRNHIPAYKPTFIPEWTQKGLHAENWMENTLRDLEGCVLVSMFSMSCSSHDPKCNYVPNKCLPWEKWIPVLEYLWRWAGERGIPIRYLGAPTDKIPNEFMESNLIRPEDIVFGIPLNRLAHIMQKAKLLVTIDNGMSHLAASQECPTFLMYPQCLAPYYILPIGNPNMTYIQMNPVTVKTDYIVQALDFSVKRLCKEKKIKGEEK